MVYIWRSHELDSNLDLANIHIVDLGLKNNLFNDSVTTAIIEHIVFPEVLGIPLELHIPAIDIEPVNRQDLIAIHIMV